MPSPVRPGLAVSSALTIPRARGHARAGTAVDPVLADGTIDYFATSLSELLLFPPKEPRLPKKIRSA
ncbi:hypothetical protein GCM10027059_29090 [Myceligenerans halotolerans]